MVQKWSGTSYDKHVLKFIASDHRVQVFSQSDSQEAKYGFVLGFEAVLRNQTRPTLHEETGSLPHSFSFFCFLIDLILYLCLSEARIPGSKKLFLISYPELAKFI